MVMLKALGIALSTYTILPVGHFSWEERPMRYSICFLPAAGLIVGGLWLLWSWLAARFGFGELLYAAVAAALPALLTGGIHLDGYLDTVDALSSQAPRERKLEILKDPRAGAFAVIWGGVYFLLSLGLHAALPFGPAARAMAAGFVLSRALTALAALTQKNARGEGLLVSFTAHAPRRACRAAMLAVSLLAAAAMLYAAPLAGGLALACAAAALLVGSLVVRRQFGGATGDTCGFLITLTELAILLGLAAGRLAGLSAA